MGWASASSIFDPVAQALITAGATDDMKTTVLGDLIKTLQDGDWDTEGESLDQFRYDPAIVEAFRRNGVVIACDAYDEERHLGCELETGHAGDHRCWNGQTWASPAGGLRSHGDILRPADTVSSDAVQWQLRCPVCGAAEIERGKPNDATRPAALDRSEGVTTFTRADDAYRPIGTRGGHVQIDMYCAAGHAFQLIVANHKGAEYIALLT